ncbi:MAG: hypothetical protein AUH85_00140 [Chloroflexi bacterium 13_1_40CM_4_68_4]|nr:MAG: hypothetical protein AUH85_00140 [Chloroflexi bacterium 13_1_40CM_4_68_4]
MKGRLEAFADGVFAIAITLLVFEIKIPPSDGPLLPGLVAQWAFFAAYVASFLQIGVYWMSHHIASTYLQRVDGRLLFVNLLFLLTIAFIPFPTELLADRLSSGVDMNIAMALYGLWMLLTAATAAAVLVVILHDDLMDNAAYMREAPAALTRRYWLGGAVYAIAVIVALVAPLVALVFYLVGPIYYGIEAARWRPGQRTAREAA